MNTRLGVQGIADCHPESVIVYPYDDLLFDGLEYVLDQLKIVKEALSSMTDADLEKRIKALVESHPSQHTRETLLATLPNIPMKQFDKVFWGMWGNNKLINPAGGKLVCATAA